MKASACPQCGDQSLSFWQKQGLGLGRAIPCPVCGAQLKVPWAFGLAYMLLGFFLPWFGGFAALSLVFGVSFSNIAALPVIFMLGMLLVSAPMAWLYHRYAPLTYPPGLTRALSGFRRVLRKAFVGLILLLVVLFFYFDSDFSEARRLKGVIEQDFALKSIDLPELMYRENYGWAEEGGDRSLMLLSPKTCTALSLVMTGVEAPNVNSDYLPVFSRNKVTPVFVKTWRNSDGQGDSVFYALDEESCNLYRRYHYE